MIYARGANVLEKRFLKAIKYVVCILYYISLYVCGILNGFQNSLCEARMRQSGVLFPHWVLTPFSLLSIFFTYLLGVF